jgi:hypothetical protein
LPICGATSVSQMAVSTASTWQKKGRMPLNVMVPPVLEQARGFRRHAPVVRVLDAAPLVHLLAHGVDHGRVWSYSWAWVESPLPFVEAEARLACLRPCASWASGSG